MARSGDEISAGAGRYSHMRVSPADRERVVDALKAAFVQGRLAKDEFDLRIGQVLAARTHADLAVLTTHLPSGLTGARAPEHIRESRDTKTLVPGGRIEVLVALAVAAASIVTAIMIHRPVTYCSYPGGPPPPGCITSDYSMSLRAWIVASGFIVAGLIIAVGRYARRGRGRGGSDLAVSNDL